MSVFVTWIMNPILNGRERNRMLEERRELGCGGISRRGEGLGAKWKVIVDQTLILNPLCSAANLPHCAFLCVCVPVCVTVLFENFGALYFDLKRKRSTVAADTHEHTQTQGLSQTHSSTLSWSTSSPHWGFVILRAFQVQHPGVEVTYKSQGRTGHRPKHWACATSCSVCPGKPHKGE